MGNIPVTTTTKISPKVLRYKWEAYCNTNGGRTAIQMGGVLTILPFPQSEGAPKALQYKLEAYCNTNGRCIAILFWEVVVVGVSDILCGSRMLWCFAPSVASKIRKLRLIGKWNRKIGKSDFPSFYRVSKSRVCLICKIQVPRR